MRLTRAGLRAHADLDARSANENRSLLEALAEDEQERVLGAMGAIEGLLGSAPAAAAEPVLRAPRAGDYGWIVERHGALYTQEYGWDERFEVLVARIVADFAEDHDPAREAAWIAEVDGRRAGCVLCVQADERHREAAAPARRALGARHGRGRRAWWSECLEFARAAGYEEITLWTNHVLRDARRIYERAGFALVAEKPHRRFGPKLVGQDWSRALAHD